MTLQANDTGPTADTPSHTEPRFRTGAAARLAGIAVETLRVWERRYRVVGPNMSARGQRQYSEADVARLTLIRQLVDRGHAIGTVAPLDDATLRGLMASGSVLRPAMPVGSSPARVAVAGATLRERLTREAERLPGLRVVAAAADLETLAHEAVIEDGVDVLLVDLTALHEDQVEAIGTAARRIGAARAVVLHRFGTQAAARALRARGHRVARAPVSTERLAVLCAPVTAPDARLAPVPARELPARRFDARALDAVARASRSLQCECPRHVADLLADLSAFEEYSAECSRRNAADAAMHDYLQSVAGSARVMFEEALARLARVEGIALPGASE